MMHNNQIYGLTKGQGSPTSDPGLVTSLQPHGVVMTPVKAPALALILGCGFIARGFSGDSKGLSEIIQAAVKHRGFSFIEVLQPCISMNKVNTFAWYKSRYKLISDIEPGYDPADYNAALRTTALWGDTIPGGILYQSEAQTPFEDKIPLLAEGPYFKTLCSRCSREKTVSPLKTHAPYPSDLSFVFLQERIRLYIYGLISFFEDRLFRYTTKCDMRTFAYLRGKGAPK